MPILNAIIRLAGRWFERIRTGDLLRTLHLYLLLNFPLTLLIHSRYIALAETTGTYEEWLFLLSALVGNTAMLYLLLGLILIPVAIIIPSRILTLVISTIAIWLLNFISVFDLVIYNMYRFHLNGLVLNVLTTSGASDSVSLGVVTVILTIGLILGLLALAGMMHWLVIKLRKAGWLNWPLPMLYSVTIIVILLLNLVDKAQYARADLLNRTIVTRYARLLPLYQPLTIKKFAAKHWGIEVNREWELERAAGGILNYPLTELEFDEPDLKPNFILIVIDSWRYDMLNAAVTPNISAYAEEAKVFERHYSGGNATRFGMFSLLYGLHGTYWYTFLAERKGPVLIRRLKDTGYALKIISSTTLTFPEFRRTLFVDIPESIDDRIEGDGTRMRDPKQLPLLESWLDTLPADQPFFAMMLLDAPHGGGDYDPSMAKFFPHVSDINYLALNKELDSTPYLNHYKNAIYFDDVIVGNVLDMLDDRGFHKNTVVLMTGDHGGEFYEHGYWGHTGAFTPEQVKVPFVMGGPGVGKGRVDRLTSHADLASTILELIGCNTPAEEYSQGISMLRAQPEREFVVSSGWEDFAIIDTAVTLVISSQMYNLVGIKVYDSEYHLITENESELESRLPYLRAVMDEFSQFYQR